MQYECEAEPEGPVLWTDINGVKHTTPPGTMRSFSMNSREFYEAVTEPSDRPSWGPGLPNFPHGRDQWAITDEAYGTPTPR